MKFFDFAIGNPPYQEEAKESENKTFMPPVYNVFMDEAFKVADKVELIHPARFLFNAGQTPKLWNQKMLDDPHFKILQYVADASSVFPNTYINGGVAISYRSKADNYGAIGTFTSFDPLNGIIHKIRPSLAEKNLGNIVINQNRFDLDALYSSHPEVKAVIGSDGRDRRFRNNIFEKIALFDDVQKSKDDIRVLGVVKGKRVFRYFPKQFTDVKHENLYKWKAAISSADGAAGTIGAPIPARIIGEAVILQPGEAYTQTFIGVGAVDTEREAEAIKKYLKTKFCRVLTGILKNTQHITPDIFSFVPLQDFTDASDIDWKKSIAEIDRQLYGKYGLDQSEIDFIESHIKEME